MSDIDDDAISYKDSNAKSASPLEKEELIQQFDTKLMIMSDALNAVKGKCTVLAQRAISADLESSSAADRAGLAESRLADLSKEIEGFQTREQMLKQELIRLEAMVQAERIQGCYAEQRLKQMLSEERIRYERMRGAMDDVVMQRDVAVSELATAYADMDAMQATLSDSAVYVRYLRRKVLELELQNTRNAADSLMRERMNASEPESAVGVFSLSGIKGAIQKAVREACECPEDEKRRRLKQLQLRWHPDKNPVLAELATEVTKLIHEAVAEHSGSSVGA